MAQTESSENAAEAALADTGERLHRVRQALGRIIYGQDEVIEQSLITLLAGGHGLLVGVPGLAKTRLVETLAEVFGLDSRRIQCTPDLMPADITGSEVLEESADGTRSFRFVKGPVFCQLFMADEINRASPRTQSALLQAMQEHEVSVGGHYYALPEPFHVLATQNPIEQEGTYPLPEAQLDRFLMQIDIAYPGHAAERQMLLATTGTAPSAAGQILDTQTVQHAQDLVRRLPLGESVVEAILTLVRRGRPESADLAEIRDNLAWGPGPRASQALALAAKARAVLHGRPAPSVADIVALAPPVLRHRLGLTFAARAEGMDSDAVVRRLAEALG